MARMRRASAPPPEQILRIAGLIGADWAATGAVGVNAEGTFDLKIRVRHTKLADRDYTRTVQAPTVKGLLEAATKAVLESAGVVLNEEQRKRVSSTPGGSASAVEYHAKAVRAVRTGKPNDALYYVSQSRRYDAHFRPALTLLGQMNIAAGNQAEVSLVFERLLREAKLDDDPIDLIVAMTQIAIVHQRARRLGVTEKYYQAALDKARQIGLTDLEAVLLGAMATLRLDQRKHNEALVLIQERLRLLELQGDRLGMGPAYLTLGLVHSAGKQTRQALACLSRAAELADEVGIAADKAVALFQIGELNREEGNLDEALKAYRASLAVSEERESGSAYRQIAQVHEQQGQYDEALKMLRKAESVLAGRKAYAQQADCLTRIARIHAKRNDHAKAADIMSEAVEILTDLGHPELPTYKKELAEIRAKAKPR